MTLARLLCLVGRHSMMRWRSHTDESAGTYRLRRCRHCGKSEKGAARTPINRKRQLAEAADATVRG